MVAARMCARCGWARTHTHTHTHTHKHLNTHARARALGAQSFTTCLTDGTEAELLPGGRAVRVTFERRAEYRALATVRPAVRENDPHSHQI